MTFILSQNQYLSILKNPNSVIMPVTTPPTKTSPSRSAPDKSGLSVQKTVKTVKKNDKVKSKAEKGKDKSRGGDKGATDKEMRLLRITMVKKRNQ